MSHDCGYRLGVFGSVVDVHRHALDCPTSSCNRMRGSQRFAVVVFPFQVGGSLSYLFLSVDGDRKGGGQGTEKTRDR